MRRPAGRRSSWLLATPAARALRRQAHTPPGECKCQREDSRTASRNGVPDIGTKARLTLPPRLTGSCPDGLMPGGVGADDQPPRTLSMRCLSMAGSLRLSGAERPVLALVCAAASFRCDMGLVRAPHQQAVSYSPAMVICAGCSMVNLWRIVAACPPSSDSSQMSSPRSFCWAGLGLVSRSRTLISPLVDTGMWS